MASAAGSIPPLAPSYRPPPPVLSLVPPASGQRDSRARLKAYAPPRVLPHAPAAAAPRALPQPPAALTAIAFRPDGRPAITLRFGGVQLAAIALTLASALSFALAVGWLIGVWTAHL